MNNAVSKGWGLGTDSGEDGTNNLERGDFVDVMNIEGFERGHTPFRGGPGVSPGKPLRTGGDNRRPF